MDVGALVRWYVGTLVRWYVGMTTSTTAPASCYLGRRRWTRCRSCSTGCREMALLPLRDGELPLESIVTQSSDCAVTAELRHDPPGVLCRAAPSQAPRPSPLSLARTCLHGPHAGSSCVQRVQASNHFNMFYLKNRGNSRAVLAEAVTAYGVSCTPFGSFPEA